MVLKNTVCFLKGFWILPFDLLVRVVLGHSLGTLGHGVLGQLTGQNQTDSGLDLAGGNGVALVVTGQTSTLGGNALKDIVNERVHDHHSLLGHSSIGVHLLQHLVDVRGVRVGVSLLSALARVGRLLRGLTSLSGSLSGCLCLSFKPRQRPLNRINKNCAPKKRKKKRKEDRPSREDS